MGKQLLLVIVALVCLFNASYADVTFDAQGTAVDQTGVTTRAFTTLTVGACSNRNLNALANFTGTPTNVTATWDVAGSNQPMVLISSASTTTNAQSSFVFGLTNPVSGNKTLTFNWTTSAEINVQAFSTCGGDQTGGATTFYSSATVRGTSAAPAITVTTATGDMAVANMVCCSANGISSFNQTALFLIHGTGAIESAGSRGTAATTLAFTGALAGSDVWAATGFSIKAAPTAPTLETDGVTNVTRTTATGSGTSLTSGTSITDEGVCYATHGAPTLSDTCVSSGSTAITSFTASLTGLTANTLYYTAAYATNSIGTSYGADVPFKTGSDAGVSTITGTGIMAVIAGVGFMLIQ